MAAQSPAVAAGVSDGAASSTPPPEVSSPADPPPFVKDPPPTSPTIHPSSSSMGTASSPPSTPAALHTSSGGGHLPPATGIVDDVRSPTIATDTDSPSPQFDQTDTEKVDDDQQGLEVWVADDTVLDDVGGRNWRMDPGTTTPKLLSDEPASMQDEDDVDQPVDTEGSVPPGTSLDTEGGMSLTGVGSSSPYKHSEKSLASLPQTPAFSAIDQSFLLAPLSPITRIDEDLGSDTLSRSIVSVPEEDLKSSTHQSQKPSLALSQAENLEVKDDIIGAVTVTRKSGNKSEFASSDPQLLGRHVSSSQRRTSMTLSPINGVDSALVNGDTPNDVSQTTIKGRQKNATRSGSAPSPSLPPVVALDDVVGTQQRKSRSTRQSPDGRYSVPPPANYSSKPVAVGQAEGPHPNVRHSVQPMATWSRYPIPSPGPTSQMTQGFNGVNGMSNLYDNSVALLSGRVDSNVRVQSAPYGSSRPSAGLRSQPDPPAEVCVECMMRDQDMVGIDVTSPSAWARRSDIDFEEALAQEEADDRSSMVLHRRGSEATSGQCESSDGTSPAHSGAIDSEGQCRKPSSSVVSVGVSATGGGAGSSKESFLPDRSGKVVLRKKRRLGRGQALTTAGLRLWTQMNPPASSHRWKTLQAFLQEQVHYLELEHRARIASQMDSERAEHQWRASQDATRVVSRTSQSDATSRTGQGEHYPFLNVAPSAAAAASSGTLPSSTSSKGRGRTSKTLLPSGMIMETVDISRDEREAKASAKSKQRSSRISLTGPASYKSTSPSTSTRSFSAGIGEQYWAPGDNGSQWIAPLNGVHGMGFHSPTKPNGTSRTAFGNGRLAASTSDLQQQMSPRSPSPSRYSVTSRRSGFFDGRPFSIWNRGRQSGSQSILSFAPSGSMIDMHVGLSQDRHAMYGSGNDSSASLNTGYVGQQGPNLASLGAGQFVVRDEVDESGVGKGEKLKKKKGFKGFLTKIGLRTKSDSVTATMTPTRSEVDLGRMFHSQQINADDDEPLAPPPPLSILARERHRSGSTANLTSHSSTPGTPTSTRHQRAMSSASLPVIRDETGKLMTMASPAPESSQANVGNWSNTTSPSSLMNGNHFQSGVRNSRVVSMSPALKRSSSYDMLAEEIVELNQVGVEVPDGLGVDSGVEYSPGTVDGLSPMTTNSRKSTSGSWSYGPNTPHTPYGTWSPVGNVTCENRVVGLGYSSLNYAGVALRKEKSLPRLPNGVESVKSVEEEGAMTTSPTSSMPKVGDRRPSTTSTVNNNRNSTASRFTYRTSRVLSALLPGSLTGNTTGGTRGRTLSTTSMSNINGVAAQQQQQQGNTSLDYVPSEKTRHSISRSPDFLALRYAVSTPGTSA